MRILLAMAYLAFNFLSATAATAATPLFQFTTSSQPQSTALKTKSSGRGMQLSSQADELMIVGETVEVVLPNGQIAFGSVKRRIPMQKSSKAQTLSSSAAAVSRSALSAVEAESMTSISFQNRKGSLEVYQLNGSVTSMLLRDVENNAIYSAEINAEGQGDFIEEDMSAHVCIEYPAQLDSDLIQAAAADLNLATGQPDLSGLQGLQSRPESSKVLYLNYWGGTLNNTAWNDSFTNGAAINYTPYSLDANTSVFSNDDQLIMWLGWLETSEDYAPFDINVTTSQAIYDAAPENQRSQIIATQSSAWFGNAGGVAFVNSYGSNDFNTTGWTWNLAAGALGMTNSHEAGHQMGLRHDGTTTAEYYQGSGIWGPIMGAPFNKQYVQWSKGEYPNRSNVQNDISIISNKLGAVTDDASDDPTSGTALAFPSQPVLVTTGTLGISADPLISSDLDVYTFTLPFASTITLKVQSLLAAEEWNFAANVPLNITLNKRDETSGVLIEMISFHRAEDLATLSPRDNVFDFNGLLTAGTYSIEIGSRLSTPYNWSTTFGTFGASGRYQMELETDDGCSYSTICVETGGKPSICVYKKNSEAGSCGSQVGLP